MSPVSLRHGELMVFTTVGEAGGSPVGTLHVLDITELTLWG